MCGAAWQLGRVGVGCVAIALAGCARERATPESHSMATYAKGASADHGLGASPAPAKPSTTPPMPAPTAASSSRPPTSPVPLALKEVFPFIRVDVGARVVEFDGEIAIDAHHEATPLVYLEVFACTRDTREHESIVVTRARPSLVHAALLAAGFKEGKPGSWGWRAEEQKLEAIPPSGDALRVYLVVDGREIPMGETAIHALTGEPLAWTLGLERGASGGGFVFAGSVMRQRGGAERYEADGAGTLVGLATFGSEVIAWGRVYSHEASVEEPAWIANKEVVPRRGTKVAVRIRAGE